jgi:hypothetical protein
MRRRLRALVVALLGFGLMVSASGCANLLEFEQRKNQWLRETFFGGGVRQDQPCCDEAFP